MLGHFGMIPLNLTMIPGFGRTGFGRYNLPRCTYNIHWYRRPPLENAWWWLKYREILPMLYTYETNKEEGGKGDLISRFFYRHPAGRANTRFRQRFKLSSLPNWWFQPLWTIWKSVGMIVPNIWKHKIHVPNHQPATHIVSTNLQWLLGHDPWSAGGSHGPWK